MRILFVLRHAGFVRNFEAVLDQLADRGHAIHLAFELERGDLELVQALADRHPALSWGPAPVRSDRWAHVAFDLRASVSALRYRSTLYDDAPKLRERGFREAPHLIRGLTANGPFASPRGLAALDRALRRLDAAVPPSREVDAFLDAQRPDLLLVTPLVADPTQDDVVRRARARGIPAALAVASWDNLTNKGLIRPTVDHVFVWNEPQRREAVELHAQPPERVTATGAHTYDHWFRWAPSRDRAAFCAQVGLPAGRPFVLYVCSSKFIAPTEPAFVRRWLGELRAGPAPLRDAGVLIRPHPASGHWWGEQDLSDLGPVAVWPRTGADPLSAESKAGYFDSMHHAAAAVGINTSALVELAIVGTPAFTVLDPEFASTQRGTLHFAHLTETGGGILTVGETSPEHLAQLNDALAAPPPRNDAFLRDFIRPHGLDVAAAPRMADAVERVALVPERRSLTAPVADVVLRGALALAPLLVRESGRRPDLGARRRRIERRLRKQVRRTARRSYRRSRIAVGAALGRGPRG